MRAALGSWWCGTLTGAPAVDAFVDHRLIAGRGQSVFRPEILGQTNSEDDGTHR
jgi:hypothetical protein